MSVINNMKDNQNTKVVPSESFNGMSESQIQNADCVGIESGDYEYQDMVQRSIVDLIDVETGEQVDANEILNEDTATDKSVFSKIRERLILGQQKGIYKYVCAFCLQPVRLTSRRNKFQERNSNFFQHFSYSAYCPVKTVSSEHWANSWIERYHESEQYKKMTKTICEIITNNKEFTNLDRSNTQHISFNFQEKNVRMSIQLYSTYISRIVAQQATSSAFQIWIFPYFSTIQQQMCARDIYYAHKRNVFVFDRESYYSTSIHANSVYKPKYPTIPNYQFAQEESEQRGELMLNCYWQEPVIKEEKVDIVWHHKLVSFSELSFDPLKKVVYYHDSDKDFYNNSSPEKQAIINHWEEELKRILVEKEQAMIMAGNSFEQEKNSHGKAEEEKIAELIERINKGEQFKCFRDWNDGWGYRIADEIIIEGRYANKFEFDPNWIAKVKEYKYNDKGRFGAINLLGETVIPFKYSNLKHLIDDIYVFFKNKYCGCMTLDGEITIPCEYADISYAGKDRIIVDTSHYVRSKNKYRSRYSTEPKTCFAKKEGPRYLYELSSFTKLTEGYASIFAVGNYLIARTISDNSFFGSCHYQLLDMDGKLVCDYFMRKNEQILDPHYGEIDVAFIGNDRVIVQKYCENASMYDYEGNLIVVEDLYKTIEPVDEIFKVSTGKLIGYIDKDGTIIEKKVILNNGFSKVLSLGWKIYTSEGCLLTDEVFQDVIDFVEGYGIVKSGHYYCIDEKGNYLEDKENGHSSYLSFESLQKLENKAYRVKPYCSLGYGVVDYKFMQIIPCIYSNIECNGLHYILTKECFGYDSAKGCYTSKDYYAVADESGKLLPEDRTEFSNGVYKDRIFDNWAIHFTAARNTNYEFKSVDILSDKYLIAWDGKVTKDNSYQTYHSPNELPIKHLKCFDLKGNILIDGNYANIEIVTGAQLVCVDKYGTKRKIMIPEIED